MGRLLGPPPGDPRDPPEPPDPPLPPVRPGPPPPFCAWMGKAAKVIARAQNTREFKAANPGLNRMPTIRGILYLFPANAKYSLCWQGGCAESFYPCKPPGFSPPGRSESPVSGMHVMGVDAMWVKRFWGRHSALTTHCERDLNRGIHLTPLQLGALVSMVANGGTLNCKRMNARRDGTPPQAHRSLQRSRVNNSTRSQRSSHCEQYEPYGSPIRFRSPSRKAVRQALRYNGCTGVILRSRSRANAFFNTRVTATVNSNFGNSSSRAQANSWASLPAERVPPSSSQR
jgi:hypothetical protein